MIWPDALYDDCKIFPTSASAEIVSWLLESKSQASPAKDVPVMVVGHETARARCGRRRIPLSSAVVVRRDFFSENFDGILQ